MTKILVDAPGLDWKQTETLFKRCWSGCLDRTRVWLTALIPAQTSRTDRGNGPAFVSTEPHRSGVKQPETCDTVQYMRAQWCHQSAPHQNNKQALTTVLTPKRRRRGEEECLFKKSVCSASFQDVFWLVGSWMWVTAAVTQWEFGYWRSTLELPKLQLSCRWTCLTQILPYLFNHSETADDPEVWRGLRRPETDRAQRELKEKLQRCCVKCLFDRADLNIRCSRGAAVGPEASSPQQHANSLGNPVYTQPVMIITFFTKLNKWCAGDGSMQHFDLKPLNICILWYKEQ